MCLGGAHPGCVTSENPPEEKGGRNGGPGGTLGRLRRLGITTTDGRSTLGPTIGRFAKKQPLFSETSTLIADSLPRTRAPRLPWRRSPIRQRRVPLFSSRKLLVRSAFATVSPLVFRVKLYFWSPPLPPGATFAWSCKPLPCMESKDGAGFPEKTTVWGNFRRCKKVDWGDWRGIFFGWRAWRQA